MSQERNKVGRNSSCPCGSGKKFKKCHGSEKVLPLPQFEEAIDPRVKEFVLGRTLAKQRQLEKQQGLGKPIISAEINGVRVVAVNNRIQASKKWKSFHDYLADHSREVLGADWGNIELAKSFDEMHPILQWYQKMCFYQNSHIKVPGEVTSFSSNGYCKGYLDLAYSLYLIDHNKGIQELVVKRLKRHGTFTGAYHEAKVASMFIKAGFEIEFEDETDSTGTHAEFSATTKSGKKYWVEAKVVHRTGVMGASVGNVEKVRVRALLHDALRKEAKNPRIVVIELCLSDEKQGIESPEWAEKIIEQIKLSESESDLPPAYVILTNHSFFHNMDSTTYRCVAFCFGFKISDFGWTATFSTLREAGDAHFKHLDVHNLLNSFREHSEIPATFDGDLPELAFGKQEVPRLIIGNRYQIPLENGERCFGELVDATVDIQNKSAFCVVRTDGNQNHIVTIPLTENESRAYEKYPETFFGKYKEPTQNFTNPLDLYLWLLKCYATTPREKLLEFLATASDYEQLKMLPREELLKHYCERTTLRIQ